jgi:predicted SAM-dependent methyltransferase
VEQKEITPMTKLHLGCGRNYLEGYVNIDFPASEHTVQSGIKADVYSDIVLLSYPHNSIQEIRLHHVFEHFSRPIAIALLCRWRNWLRPGGVLRIETPDALACFKLMLSYFTTFESKQQIMRHLFGSHEASWAFHADGWYEDKFQITLARLGFIKIKAIKTKWEMLRNIEIEAIKSMEILHTADFEKASRGLLTMSVIRMKQNEEIIIPESEVDMIRVWMDTWKSTYDI